ncbi:MAG: hypothetical protein HN553_06745 [Opitutae bacterium]|nr:hypothetical protein [Opitutae bacterium]
MDLEENNESTEGVVKWPFYFAALFILILVLGFAYVQLKTNDLLDTWQLITCILASGIASILVFIPHLIDRFFAIALDPSKFKNDELERKTYFDLKEMRGELEAIAVKIDKVPTLVDKIVTEAGNKIEVNPAITDLTNNLELAQNTLLEKISAVEELILHPPLLPETEQCDSQTGKKLDSLQKSVDSITKQAEQLQVLITSISISNSNGENTPIEIEEEIDDQKVLSDEVDDLSDGLELSDPENIDSDNDEGFEQDELPEDQFVDPEPEEESLNVLDESEIQTENLEPPVGSNLPQTTVSGLPKDEDLKKDLSENSSPASEDNQGDEEIIDEPEAVLNKEVTTDELPIELPDPAETLRKVDAILQDTDPTQPLVPEPEIEQDNIRVKPASGTTSVIANVMIGIGNKPFLRGEGPGLSWDEGVPMNFIEIGKWSWSPPRKNASLTVQLYRNDEDPDQSGKIEVKAGDKVEINPDFA